MIFTAAAATTFTALRDPALRVGSAAIAVVLVVFGVLGRQAGPSRASGLLVAAAGVAVLIRASVPRLKPSAEAGAS